MASAAYLALLQQPSAHWKVLAELTARQELHGWTSAGSGAYAIAFDPYTHPESLRADRGLYREISGVWENRTALTVRASLALVQANPGSWFFDTATDTLYVQTSGSVDPDTLGLVQAQFVVRVATEPVCFADIPPYDAQIDGQSLPTMRFERPELLRGISAFPSGDLTLANADGFWDYPADAWVWTNTSVAFLAGGEAMAYADYEPLPTMQIVKAPAAGDAAATWQLRSQSNATDRAFPNHTLEDFYGPSVALLGGDPGVLLPAWWGVVTEVPLTFVGDNGARNKWIPMDPFLGATGLTVTNIVAIERATGARTALATPADYLYLGGADAAVDISKTYPPADYEIICDAARPDVNCGAIAMAILLACGVASADIDSAAFTQADLDNPARLGLYVTGGHDVSVLLTGTELLNLLERSTLSSVHLGADGRWTMDVWDPSFVLSDLPRRTDADLLSWVPSSQMTAPIVSAVTVRYGRRVFADTWLTSGRTSTAAEARLQTTNTQLVDTCLVDLADVQLLSARLQLIAPSTPIEVRIQDGPALMSLVPGDKVRITRERGASRSGTFDQPMEVQSILKRISTMTIEATIGNQRGLGSLVKLCSDASVAAWGSASADEKRQYWYACDDDGFVVAGDGATYRQAVVW